MNTVHYRQALEFLEEVVASPTVPGMSFPQLLFLPFSSYTSLSPLSSLLLLLLFLFLVLLLLLLLLFFLLVRLVPNVQRHARTVAKVPGARGKLIPLAKISLSENGERERESLEDPDA